MDKEKRNPLLYRIIKFVSWGFAGVPVALTVLGVMRKLAELTNILIFWLCLTFAFFWLFLIFLSKRNILIKSDVRIKSLGPQTHMFFGGAITIFILSSLFHGVLQTQKVEIILDVSERMAAELDQPGVSKLDAARDGILQVLKTLEGQDVEVSLRLLHGTNDGQCTLSPKTSLAVDYTRNLDKISEYLSKIKIKRSDKAPLVDAIDQSIDHYDAKQSTDAQNLYLYTFVGGDDTCGKSLSLYLKSPKVRSKSVEQNIFLVLLLGRDTLPDWSDLPDVNYDFARTVQDVQEIIAANSVKLPQAKSEPSPIVTSGGESPIASVNTMPIPITGGETALEANETIASSTPKIRPSQMPRLRTSTATPKPPTFESITSTYPPSQTFTPFVTVTNSLTSPPTDTQTATSEIFPNYTDIPQATETSTELSCLTSTRMLLTDTGSFTGMVFMDKPLNCSLDLPAETSIDAGGRYFNTTPSSVLWVLVYAWNDMKYYPQSPDACSGETGIPPIQSEGLWNVNIYLGQREFPPEWFDIVFILTDQAGSDFLSTWVHSGCGPSGFSGLTASQLEQKNVTEFGYMTVRTAYTPK